MIRQVGEAAADLRSDDAMIAALEGLDVAATTWLAARDPALVHLPEALAAMEPSWSLHDVQWTPGQSCRLAYRMDVEEAEGATFVAIDLDAKSWSQHDFRSDRSLPGLSAASDPAQVVQRLTSVVEEPIQDCRVRPVRYRPGARCVLRYDVRTASGSAEYYAKVFPKSVYPDAAGRAARVAAAARSARVQVTSVVAQWPELFDDGGQGGRGAIRVGGDARRHGVRPEPDRPGPIVWADFWPSSTPCPAFRFRDEPRRATCVPSPI